MSKFHIGEIVTLDKCKDTCYRCISNVRSKLNRKKVRILKYFKGVEEDLSLYQVIMLDSGVIFNFNPKHLYKSQIKLK